MITRNIAVVVFLASAFALTWLMHESNDEDPPRGAPTVFTLLLFAGVIATLATR